MVHLDNSFITDREVAKGMKHCRTDEACVHNSTLTPIKIQSRMERRCYAEITFPASLRLHIMSASEAEAQRGEQCPGFRFLSRFLFSDISFVRDSEFSLCPMSKPRKNASTGMVFGRGRDFNALKHIILHRHSQAAASGTCSQTVAWLTHRPFTQHEGCYLCAIFPGPRLL
jgi:hypothetical protein